MTTRAVTHRSRLSSPSNVCQDGVPPYGRPHYNHNRRVRSSAPEEIHVECSSCQVSSGSQEAAHEPCDGVQVAQSGTPIGQARWDQRFVDARHSPTDVLGTARETQEESRQQENVSRVSNEGVRLPPTSGLSWSNQRRARWRRQYQV